MHIDPRVDAYIEAAAPFAQPILRHLRAAVHAADAGVGETIKWSMPFFTWGSDGKGKVAKPLANMAAFKAHCAFGFWQSIQVADPPLSEQAGQAMGQYGRITAVTDLPRKAELVAAVKRAIALVEAGVKAPRAVKAKAATPRPAPKPPAALVAALAKNAVARRGFAALPPGQQREYTDWIEEAKRDETRDRRLAQSLEWLAEGKSKNWKYQNC